VVGPVFSIFYGSRLDETMMFFVWWVVIVGLWDFLEGVGVYG